MAEFSNMRLVRCPKCENLLPEQPDISLYRCGGCGAVLKAKKKGVREGELSDVSNDLKHVKRIEEGNSFRGSEVEMESSGGSGSDRMKRVHNERGASSSSNSTSRAQSRELLADSDVNRRGKERIRRLEHLDEGYMSYSWSPVHSRGKNHDLNVDRREHINFRSEHAQTRPPMESLRSRPVMDQWGLKSNGSEIYRGPAEPARGIISEGMYGNFRYHDEGSLTYNTNSYYKHEERTRYPSHNLDGVGTIENLEHSRAELLQKLDELTDQISRSCDLGDKPNERIGTHRNMVSPGLADPYSRNHGVYVQEHLNRSRGVSPDELRAPYTRQHPGLVPYMDRYDAIVQDSYPQRGYSHELMGYADPYQQDLLRRPHRATQSHYLHQPHHGHFSGYGGDVDMLQRHENHFNQPACPCVHCRHKNWDVAPKVDPSGSHNLLSRNEPSSPNFLHNQNPILHRPQSYGSATSNFHPLHSRQSSPLNSSDVDRKTDGFSNHLPMKVLAAHTNVKLWHPFAGGAPFVTCSNCFELLKLPRKHISSAKHRQKIKCGACSSIMLFELGNKGFALSASARVEEVPTEIDDVPSGAGDENAKYWHGGSNSADMNTCSNDNNDSQLKLSPIEKEPTSGEFEKQSDPLSPTSILSEAEESPEKLPSEKHDSPSATLPLTQDESSPQPGLSSQECLPDHCSDNVEVNRFEMGNKSLRSEQERVFEVSRLEKGNESIRSEQERALLDASISQQNSVEDAAVATEMDGSLNEFSNSCVSQDSVDISKEDHPGISRRGNKSFREFAKSNQIAEVGESQVYVNGHLIPDIAVTKAERLAGPIQPGEYWYDYQAGFWGVMGHPCLGIIMPTIEEFNYPIPENCAAGNTRVFVNGRELHQKDFELLASRGLPTTKHRSYTVEISGEVVDDQTGEELDGLGKLAPTVEKANQGFGMKVPRFIAQLQS